MALDDLPPLGSRELEALLMEGLKPLDEVPYPLMDQPSAEWLLDPSPAGSGAPLAGAPAAAFGMTSPGADTSALPAALPDMFLDPFMGSMADFVPMPPLGGDTFIPPPMQASSGDGSGDGSAHYGLAAPTSSGDAAPTSAPRKGRGAGGKKELSEAQKERIKAKNRRAQNRYREKQKQKAVAAEQEFNDTAVQLERMRLENARLQEQHAAMQKVLNVRESAMEVLQAGKAADEEERQAAGEATQALPCGCSTPEACTCEQAAAPAGARPPSQALQQAGAHKGGKQGGKKGGGCPLTGLTLSQIAELKKTPPEVLKQNWKSIAQRLEIILQQKAAAEGSADPSLVARTEALDEQLSEVLYEGQAFCFEHAIYQPTNVQKLFAAALDDGRSDVAPDDMRHWEAVAGAVQLSAQQLDRVAAARANFLQRIQEVCAERRLIFDRLQAIQVPTTLRAMQQATASWLQVHEATADLSANMTQEHCVCMSFVRDAFGYVLSPQQKAVAVVRSYPYFPDMYSIGTAALQAAGSLGAGDDRRLLAARAPAAAGAAATPVAVAVN